MANKRKQFKSCPCLLKENAATAGISKKIHELREAFEECISACEQHGDGNTDDDSRYLAKTLL